MSHSGHFPNFYFFFVFASSPPPEFGDGKRTEGGGGAAALAGAAESMRSGARSRDEQAQKSPAILRAGRDARQDLQGEDTPEVARHRGFVGTPRQASSSSQSRREDDELNAIVNGPDFAAMWEDLGTEFFDGEDVGGQASPSVSHAVNAAANLAVNEATAVLVQSQKNSAHREKGDLAREGRPVSVELFGDDDDDDEREDNDEADGSRSLSPDVSSGPGDESLSPEVSITPA